MSTPRVFPLIEEATNELPNYLPGPEIWGGVECSVNRVGDTYFDQFERSGHKDRPEDLDQIVELGIRALRYPILWEHHANQPVDWAWADQRMGRLRDVKIEPIVGLVHHGSGPRDTNLLDPNFPLSLAAHAGRVAERFPWIKCYNPVNEPVTTARFSGLYRHWYPHGRDASTFHRALLTECQGVRAAMKAIRLHNSEAMLVQTEDMGHTYSTPALQYQADFDNARRWLSLDLLCGRLNRDHPLWGYLLEKGVGQAELESFLTDPCPPDIIGINYYITSERFLDERLENYPTRSHGGNGRHRYADVSAVRVSGIGIAGPYGILDEAWKRYGLPLAVTEAHLGCTRDEQLRWLIEVWDAAKRLREEGCDLRAVTVWSLLGAYDWNSLLTRNEGYYEPGAFDLRSARPRPTALAKCVQALAARGDHHHPILHQEGWWRRATRLLYPVAYPAVCHQTPCHPNPKRFRSKAATPILITGATGTLGQAFRRLCKSRGLAHRLLTRQELDIASPEIVSSMLDAARPWAVINTAGYVRVDDAEWDAAACRRENTVGPCVLAKVCGDKGIPLLTFSSDLVFDGAKQNPYLETDRVSPLNVYGSSKAEAERLVMEFAPKSLIIRTSAFFGPWDKYNFLTVLRRKLLAGEIATAIEDAVVSPTYVPDLVHASLDLLIDGEIGIWHLANRGSVTWYELAKTVARTLNLPEELIEPLRLEQAGYPAERPRYSVLGSGRGEVMPTLEDALGRYIDEYVVAGEEPEPSQTAGCSNRSQSESTKDAVSSSSVGI